MYHHSLVHLYDVVKELAGLRNQDRQHLVEREDAGYWEDESYWGDLEVRGWAGHWLWLWLTTNLSVANISIELSQPGQAEDPECQSDQEQNDTEEVERDNSW